MENFRLWKHLLERVYHAYVVEQIFLSKNYVSHLQIGQVLTKLQAIK